MAPTREAWKDPEQGCGCSTEGPSLGATGGGALAPSARAGQLHARCGLSYVDT